MKRVCLWVLVAVVVGFVTAVTSVRAEEVAKPAERKDHILAGVDFGATGAMAPMKKRVNVGASLNPWGAYMLNRWVGVMGQAHVVAIPNKDSDDTLLEDDSTFALGATFGPRFALPLGWLEAYGTFQLGGFTGLQSHSPINDESWAFSTGGGVNLDATKNIRLGAFGRYNRLYQQSYGDGDVKYAVGGVSVTFLFDVPEMAVPTVSVGGGAPPPK